MNKFRPHSLEFVINKIQKITLLFLSVALIMTMTSCATRDYRGPCGSLWDSDVLKKGNAEKVEYLIDCGANVNQHNALGETPLHRAVDLGGTGDVASGSVNAKKGIIGDLSIVELLLANGADPRAADRNQVTPLHYANHTQIAELLIEHGAKVNALTISGYTPLHYIAERGYGVQGSLAAAKTAEVLIKRGANVNVVAKDGSTPLYKAVLNNKVEMARLLLRHGANPNAIITKSQNSLSPLAVAVSIGGYGDVAMVELLLAHGANANVVGTAGTTPLHYACQAKIAVLLIDHGANVNNLGTADITPLYAASYRGDKEVVQVLLSRKADPNKQNKKGSRPLHVAANRGYKDVVGTLITNGADVHAIDANGWTALHHAAYQRRASAIEELLANHSEVNAMTHQGSTPLHLAVQHGKDPSELQEQMDAIAVLLTHGADMEKRNGDGQTPLLIASRRCNVSDVELLLAGGADVTVVRTEWKSRPPSGDGCKAVGALLF
jgi:ankyrin repeat protein